MMLTNNYTPITTTCQGLKTFMKTARIKLNNGFKPYPKYKDSGVEWIGKIPEEWDITPLRSVAIENNERNFDGKCSRLLSLSYGKIIEKDINTSSGLLPESFHTYQIVRNGNIVFRLTDLQNDKKSLRVGYVDINGHGIITSAYLALRVREYLDDKFAYYLFHAYDLQKVYYGMGGGVRQTLDYSDFKYLPIIFPSLNFQKKMAGYLDKKIELIDQIIEKKKQLTELLREKRTAVINQAVTKGLDPKAELIDSGIDWIGKIPKGWEADRMSHYFSANDGGVWGEDDPLGIGKIVLRSTEINQDGSWNLESAITRQLTSAEFLKTKLVDGDLLITKSSGSVDHLGKTAIVSKEIAEKGCAYSNFMQRARLNGKMLPKFFFYLINNKIGRDQINYWGLTTSGLVNINRDLIGRFTFPVPPVEVQKEIIEQLDEKTHFLDLTILKVRQSIETLKEFKSSLISSVVTGKVKV